MSVTVNKISQAIRIGGMFLAVLDCTKMNDDVLITRVNVPRDQRGKGHGNALMDKACAAADRLGVTLFLEVQPYDNDDGNSMDAAQLTEWYRKFGFEECGPYTMKREPQ